VGICSVERFELVDFELINVGDGATSAIEKPERSLFETVIKDGAVSAFHLLVTALALSGVVK